MPTRFFLIIVVVVTVVVVVVAVVVVVVLLVSSNGCRSIGGCSSRYIKRVKGLHAHQVACWLYSLRVDL